MAAVADTVSPEDEPAESDSSPCNDSISCSAILLGTASGVADASEPVAELSACATADELSSTVASDGSENTISAASATDKLSFSGSAPTPCSIEAGSCNPVGLAGSAESFSCSVSSSACVSVSTNSSEEIECVVISAVLPTTLAESSESSASDKLSSSPASAGDLLASASGTSVALALIGTILSSDASDKPPSSSSISLLLRGLVSGLSLSSLIAMSDKSVSTV